MGTRRQADSAAEPDIKMGRCSQLPDVFSRIISLFARIGRGAHAQSTALHLSPFLLFILILPIPIQAQSEHPHILLVADPDMESPIFRHTVVLVAPQDNGSALGIILNRLIPFEPGSDYQGDELLRDAGPIHFGGPVNPAGLIFLFRTDSMPERSIHLFADVYFSSDRELLAEQLKRPREQSFLQLYAGHAGWAPGHLQAEISRGGWSVVPATTKLVFETNRDTLWRQLSQKQRDKSI